jgi:dTDP-4-amino-4,6-dideoxygalactose transaminase
LVLNGVKNKYSWVDKGSSYLLSDILAAMLLAQLENEDPIRQKRSLITDAYFEIFKPLADRKLVSIFSPMHTQIINHHAFWVIFNNVENKLIFMNSLREKNISAYIGYLPLHSSPKGLSLGYNLGDLPITEEMAERIVRLPFYTELADLGLNYCVTEMKNVLRIIYPD